MKNNNKTLKVKEDKLNYLLGEMLSSFRTNDYKTTNETMEEIGKFLLPQQPKGIKDDIKIHQNIDDWAKQAFKHGWINTLDWEDWTELSASIASYIRGEHKK